MISVPIMMNLVIIMVIYTIYYVNWMWVQLLGPVGLRVAVLVLFSSKSTLSESFEIGLN